MERVWRATLPGREDKEHGQRRCSPVGLTAVAAPQLQLGAHPNMSTLASPPPLVTSCPSPSLHCMQCLRLCDDKYGLKGTSGKSTSPYLSSQTTLASVSQQGEWKVKAAAGVDACVLGVITIDLLARSGSAAGGCM